MNSAKLDAHEGVFSDIAAIMIGKIQQLQTPSRRRLSKPLRKHAYSNILKILPPKNENFQTKNPVIFYTSPQNIDCGYSLEPPQRGGSNEYPQLKT